MYTEHHRPRWHRAAALAAAAVWLHQGLWCKVLRGEGTHGAVVASVPGLPERSAPSVTVGLGLAESALAVLVATQGHRRSVAILQAALVGSFNAGGLLVGRRHIARPARLLARNALFVALIWSAVDGDDRG